MDRADGARAARLLLREKRDRTVQFSSSVVSPYIELIEAAAPVTQEHDVLVCLQIDAPSSRGGEQTRRR